MIIILTLFIIQGTRSSQQETFLLMTLPGIQPTTLLLETTTPPNQPTSQAWKTGSHDFPQLEKALLKLRRDWKTGGWNRHFPSYFFLSGLHLEQRFLSPTNTAPFPSLPSSCCFCHSLHCLFIVLCLSQSCLKWRSDWYIPYFFVCVCLLLDI